MNEYGVALIHGAGLGSWVWREVASLLKVPSKAVGFPAEVNGLPDNSTQTLTDYVDCIRSQLDALDVSKLVIVGHSIGAILGLEVIENHAKPVTGFLGVSATIPKPNHSFVSTLPAPQRFVAKPAMRIFGTRPSKRSIEATLCHDLTPEQTEKVTTEWCHESVDLFTNPISSIIPSGPKGYIITTSDKFVSATQQQVMAKQLHAKHTQPLAAGHLSMLSNPIKLAESINQFCGIVEENNHS